MQNIQREACYCSKTYRKVKGWTILKIYECFIWIRFCSTFQYCTQYIYVYYESFFTTKRVYSTVQCMHCLINFTVYVESVTQDVFQNPILLINQLDLVSKSYSFFQICWTYSTVVSKSDYPYKSVGPSFQILLSL